jgi:hypothetical protein
MRHEQSCMQHESIRNVLASVETAVDAADYQKDGQLRGDTNPRNALMSRGRNKSEIIQPVLTNYVETVFTKQSKKLVETPLVTRILRVV